MWAPNNNKAVFQFIGATVLIICNYVISLVNFQQSNPFGVCEKHIDQ